MRRMALFLALSGLTSCQDYRFNPVGKCLIQPGQARVEVANISTADILFVVDDSFSMDPIQTNLANNFGAFIQRLAMTQQDRVAQGKEALDFYIAITTSSVLVNRYDGINGSCGRITPNLCSIDNPPRNVSRPPYTYACSGNESCGDIWTDYYNYSTPGASDSCLPGVLSANGDPYPSGALVSAANASEPSGRNPRVLSFTKNLDWANHATDATIQNLMRQFSQNILVGSCGGNQEMHFEAGKLALQKAQGLPAGVTWPHANSKLVLVFIGNEDDCSTKRADLGGLVWSGGAGSGIDSCAGEAAVAPASSRLYPVADYASYFLGQGRPLGAAFIRPGDPGCAWEGESCPSPPCGGYGKATRFKELAAAFSAGGASVVQGSVCDANFSTTLQSIADLVKPPDRLNLPSAPAAGQVTQLRVEGADGKTLHVCAGPDPAREWWFVDCASTTTPPTPLSSGTSACIRLLAGSACEPGAGQTLRAEYLGRVPAGGCSDTTDPPGGPSRECAVALTNDDANASSYFCEGANAATSTKGTCLCAKP